MSTPVKPWENANSSSIGHYNMHNSGHTRTVLNSNAPLSSQVPVSGPGVPQLPPRPPQLAVTPRHFLNRGNGYSSMYGGYSGYGGYHSIGAYPGNMCPPGSYGYGNYGQPGALENRFLQLAEERSRGAFQSIESLVQAFTSVSMMLDSTYHAMYSSFRAILGVVDNFSRLRQMFSQFITTITILRIIKNFYRKLLHWLGIIDKSHQPEKIWEATTSCTDTSLQASTYSSWPLFTFIGLLFGGPFLVSKLFSSNIDQKKWDEEKGKFCKTAYPHKAASSSELSFRVNETLNIAPPEMQLKNNGGWLLASNKFGQTGYVPVTLLSKGWINPGPESFSNKKTTYIKTDAETKE